MADHFTTNPVLVNMRERAITLLSLWGWEPVERSDAKSADVRLLNRGEWLNFSTNGSEWKIVKFDPGAAWMWQPCEWARFSTWTLKRCIKLIEGPSWPFSNGK